MYPAELVKPMKEDLTNVGFVQLETASAVDQAIPSSEGVTLVVVNSVCGCAAGNLRPGVKLSLNNENYILYLLVSTPKQHNKQEIIFYHSLHHLLQWRCSKTENWYTF
jgi:hypothetical protein